MRELTKHVSTTDLESINNISIRDFFAGCAISGCMARSEAVSSVAERAYIVADMMLAEREKNSGEEQGKKQ